MRERGRGRARSPRRDAASLGLCEFFLASGIGQTRVCGGCSQGDLRMPRSSQNGAPRDRHQHSAIQDQSSQDSRPRFGRRNESDGFTCVNCGAHVRGVAWGTSQRNHCPNCLHSKHVDDRPGDRASMCGGTMEPIAIAVRSDGDDAGEWVLVHRCRGCGALKSNRIAGDDCERALLALALRPLARPAFPIDDLRGS